MNETYEKHTDGDDPLPEHIQAALRRRYGNIPGMSAEVDRAILADAQQYLKETAREVSATRRSRFGRWAAFRSSVVLASSVVAASAVVLLWLSDRPKSPVSVQTASREVQAFRSEDIGAEGVTAAAASRVDSMRRDVDRNGRVDILDAFALARMIRQDDSAFNDINGDGRSDQRDIDLVARDAVRL
jgi:hypothetical protein